MNALYHQRSESITVTLPGNLGTVTIRPMSHQEVIVQSQALLIGPALYSFNATLRKNGERWYFIDKAEIGVPGGRPTPKIYQATLETIASTLNTYFTTDQTFQAEMVRLQEVEAERQKRREEETLQWEWQRLKRETGEYLLRVGQARLHVQSAEEKYTQKCAEYEEFLAQHPEFVQLEQPALSEG